MHSAERADGGIVGIERRGSNGSEASRGGNGGGSGMDVGPSSPFTPVALQHHGGNGGAAAERTPEAGGSGRSIIARAGSGGRPGSGGSRPNSAGRAGRTGSGVPEWSMSPPAAAGGRGTLVKSPAARGRPAGFTGRRMLFSTVGVFITLATISMLLAPSRLSGALNMPSSPGGGSKQAKAGQYTQQADSSTAGIPWLPGMASADEQAAIPRAWRPPGPNDTALSSVQSFFTRPPGQRGGTPYFELSNVRLVNRTIWVYADPDTVANAKPFTVQTSHFAGGSSVAVQYAVWQPPHGSSTLKCSRRFRFPVALFYSPPDGSEAHYLLDGPLALFPTLDALGLLDNFSTLRDNGTDQSQYLSIKACKFRREVEGAQVVGVSWGPDDPFDPSLRWASLLKHMVERQKLVGRDFAEDAVLCFDRLVLGRSQRLDWTVTADDMAARRRVLKRYIWFAAHSAGVEHVNQLHYADMAARQALDPSLNMTLPNCRKWKLPRFLSGKPVVVLASRANATARAVLNEQQLVDYVHATYDVTLEIVTEGSKSTWQIIDLLRKADVFVGMHSDEWADAMFLKSEAVALHLVPYGWMHAPGTAKPLIRGNFYRTIVETTGASWFVWANPKPELAFFRDEDFGGDTPGVAFVPHPTADMPLPTAAAEMQAPYWIWQNTVLDMASLSPVLDNAFAAAGILLRPDVAAARAVGASAAESQPVSSVALRHTSRQMRHIVSQWWPR